MSLTASIKDLLNFIGQFNEKFFPWSIIIPGILIGIAFNFVWLVYAHPSKTVNVALKSFIGIVYVIAGLETYSITLFVSIEVFYLAGAIIMWVVAVLFFMDIFLGKTDFNFSQMISKDVKIISLLLILWGTLIYPVVECLLGFTWPGMVFFGAECPTTIFVIGLLIGSIPKTNKIIYVFLCIGAVFSGGVFGFQGAWFDIAYFASGIIGLIMFLKYWKKMNEKEER
mgnify:CR=1 FL=1